MNKSSNLVYQIIVVALFLILIFDMFIKIEYSSNKIEKALSSINQCINVAANNKDTLNIQCKALLNDNIIKINDVTNYFLSDRSISFLFTILNIFLLSIGFFLLNSFNSVNEKTSKDLEKLRGGITNINELQEKSQCEFKLYNLFNRLYSRYLSLKYGKKSSSSDSFNGELRYILISELTDLNKTIKLTKTKNIIISKAVYDFGIDIINEIKCIPNQNYTGELPDDLLAFIYITIANLDMIVEKEKIAINN